MNNNQVRYKCSNPRCRRLLRANERPCPNCGNEGRDIITQVDEGVNIKEDLTAVISKKLEFNLYLLLGSLLVTIGSPLAFFFAGKADLLSTIISIIAGLVAFGLGLYAVKQVREIYHSRGG